jgi:hypothetical protein
VVDSAAGCRSVVHARVELHLETLVLELFSHWVALYGDLDGAVGEEGGASDLKGALVSERNAEHVVLAEIDGKAPTTAQTAAHLRVTRGRTQARASASATGKVGKEDG